MNHLSSSHVQGARYDPTVAAFLLTISSAGLGIWTSSLVNILVAAGPSTTNFREGWEAAAATIWRRDRAIDAARPVILSRSPRCVCPVSCHWDCESSEDLQEGSLVELKIRSRTACAVPRWPEEATRRYIGRRRHVSSPSLEIDTRILGYSLRYLRSGERWC